MTQEEFIARCEQLGEAHVRALVLSWDGQIQGWAFEWLKLRAEEEVARREASNDEMIRYARSAKTAAIMAAIAAVIAIPIAIAGIVVSLIIR